MTTTLRTRAVGAIAAAAALTLTLAAPATADTAPPPDDWPEFGYQGVITNKAEMIYNPTNEFIFPSVFHAGEYLEDPLGEWYLYTAPHDAPAGVMLMYADSLEGPWTEYSANPIIARTWSPFYSVSHVSSPDAIWNEQAGEVYLYFHGENSTTRWATSDDGVTFEYGGVAVTNAMASPITTETSYGRVFEHPDPNSEFNYGLFYMANETDNRRKIRLAESVDGETWVVAPDYVVYPGAEEGANVSAGNLWEWNGQLYVIYHASSGKSYARTIDPTLRIVGDEPILLHQASGIGDDVGRVASPEIVTDETGTYLFYESGDRLGATIAYAKMGADVVVPPDPVGTFPVDPDNPVFAACAAPGSDEFDGTAVSADWDRVVRSADARHTVADGVLTIPTYAGGVSAAPLLQQELPDGPWQVTTHLTLDPAERYQQAGLLLYASDTKYLKFDTGVAAPGRTVEQVYYNNGSNRQDTSAPAVVQDNLWLRLTSDGTTISASVSYDGQTFSDFGRDTDVAAAGFTHIGPYAFRGPDTAAEIDATFDWFRFSPMAAAYEECMTPVEPPFGGFPVDPENPVFAACPAPGSDEFNGTTASAVWDRVVREGSARHTVADGVLTIPTYAGGVSAAPLLQQELPDGPWQVTTYVELDPAERYQQAGLLLYASDTQYLKFDMGVASPGRTIEQVYFNNGSNRQDTDPLSASYDGLWLRLTSDGTAIRASVSYDGDTFSDFGRETDVAAAGFTYVGPYAFRGPDTAEEINATFDWFRLSPTAEAYEECMTAPEPPADDETAAPAAGTLSSTSGWAYGLSDGTFDVRWDMWWGANASRVVLYRDGVEVAARDLEAGGPSAQHASFPVTGLANGSYVYELEAINSQGSTRTAPLTVTVADALPGMPQMSHDNWDGDGSFTVTASLWWGTNASSWALLEDGVEVASGDLSPATPAYQNVQVAFEDQPVGDREYVMVFTNAAGSTESVPLTVYVTR